MNKQLELSRESLSIQILPSWLEQAGIEFLFLDGDSQNWEATNVTYRFKNGPLECPFYPGYFYIPGFSRYVIDNVGKMLVVKTGKPRKWSITKASKQSIRGGYFVAPCISDAGVSKALTRHRAIALTFFEYDFHPSFKIINHKNGIGGDDRVDNLEFCTYSENTQHAYDLGLYSEKLVPIDVVNWKTDFKQSYPSIIACCDDLNLTHSFITHRLNAGNERKHDDGWRFKRSVEEWKPLNNLVKQVGTERTVTARNVLTGDCCVFSSINEAARVTGVNPGVIQTHCVEKAKTPLRGWNFRFFEDFTGWPNYSEKQIAIFRDHPVRPGDGIEVHDLKTNEVMFFTSADSAARHFNISPITISKLARYQGLRDNQFKFSLVKVRETF